MITSSHVRTLERDGIVVIPNALSAKSLIDARADLARYASKKHMFERSGVGGNETMPIGEGSGNGSLIDGDGDLVRNDIVSWLRPNRSIDESEESDIGASLAHCIDLIRGAAFSLNRFDYADSHSHQVPLQCQLAMYKGDGKCGYARHLDRCDSSLQELGLLEYFRLSDFRGRAITVILYLNDASRTEEDGGALKCWLKQTRIVGGDLDESSDTQQFGIPFLVQPVGGTMIIFHSNLLEHQVLASFKDRYALTVWVSGDLQ